MNDEYSERRKPSSEALEWHKENSRKLNLILENQAASAIRQEEMRIKMNQICGEPGSPGRMKELEQRVDTLEDAKTAMWAVGAVVGWLGLDKIYHFLSGK